MRKVYCINLVGWLLGVRDVLVSCLVCRCVVSVDGCFPFSARCFSAKYVSARVGVSSVALSQVSTRPALAVRLFRRGAFYSSAARLSCCRSHTR